MKKLVLLALVLTLTVSLFAGGAKEVEAPVASPEWEAMGTPLADLRIRQALRYAIDMETIVETVFEGKAQRAVSMTAPGSWLADGLNEYTYNPELATKLLKEAQWPSNYVLDVVYYYGDQQTVDLMSIIQQYWAQVGVKAQFRKLEGDLTAQLWVPPADRVNGPSEIKWDLAYAAVAALAEHEFYNRFDSTASNNSTLPKKAELDALIAKTNLTADVEQQKVAFKAVQKEINENMYIMPLYHQLSFIYTSDKIDLKGGKFGNDQFSYEKNLLNWTTTRPDGMIYTNTGPTEFYQMPAVNPGQFLYQEVLFDRLVNADENLTPTDGLLAKEYSVSPDGMQMVFKLRDGVKWHDGKPFTAEDVRFSIEYMLQIPGLNAVAVTTYSSIKGAQDFLDKKSDHISGIAINGNTVTITFDKLDPNALLTFSQWPILPSHLLAGSNPVTAQQNAYWQNPIGTGPFKVSQTVLGNYGILERNNDYFFKGNGNVNKIYMYSSVENDANLLKNAEGGKIDYAWSKNVQDAQGMANIKGMAVQPVNIRYTRLFYMNQYPHSANIK
ncbi:MAG: peptide ABC transporter substrate-binding protein [Spirochaetia bacterium]|nr:peptide ABC transporter substrate-binding protein [Spirochaetia bacterium]